jgi:glycosyltransferase involved in cell wall biosynthesis
VIFTHDYGSALNDEEMNFIYNSADVYINIASNEGFGLGSLESLTVGTPIVVNVTGGLQDQCGFMEEAPGGGAFKYLDEEDYVEIGSNNKRTYTTHGRWVKPVFPSNISLQGSPLTPYIFDDRASYEDAGNALLEWYNEGPEERERCGELGRKFVLSDDAKMTTKHMSDTFINSIDATFENWKPRKRYTMEVV